MAASTEFDSLWKQAVQSYISSTGRTELESSILDSIHNPDDLLAEIERKNGKFIAFREKHSKFRNVLKCALIPVTAACDIANQILANSPYAPASVVLGAIASLIQSAGGVSQVYDCIERLFGEL